MKKIITFFMILCSVVMLASCGEEKAEFSYVDGETGETVVLNVGKTDDKELITEVLENLPQPEAIPTVMGLDAEITANCDVAVKDKLDLYKMTMSTKNTANLELKVDLLNEVAYNKMYYSSENRNATYSNDGEGLKLANETATKTSSDIISHQEKSTSYIKMVDTEENLLVENSKKVEESYEYNVDDDFIMDFDFSQFLPSDDTEISVAEIVDTFDIEISKTSKNTIEFAINVDFSKPLDFETGTEIDSYLSIFGEIDEVLTVYVTYNVDKALPTKLYVSSTTVLHSFILEMMVGEEKDALVIEKQSSKLEVELNIKYEGVTVPTLTDAEKEQYISQAI